MTFMKIIEVVDDFASITIVLVGLVGFSLREKIKNYFQKDLIELKESYKQELERYKIDLLREMEEYKMGIDIRRNLSIQMSNKRLLSYQKIISYFANFIL